MLPMRAHLKRISIFPIRSGDGSFAPLLPRTLSAALRYAGEDHGSFPGATQTCAQETSSPMESAAAPQNASNRFQLLDAPIAKDVKPPVSYASQPAPHSAPLPRCCNAALAAQPLGNAQASPLVVPPFAAPELGRQGRPQKRLAPVKRNAPSVPPSNLSWQLVAASLITSARRRAQPRPPTPEDVARISRRLSKLSVA